MRRNADTGVPAVSGPRRRRSGRAHARSGWRSCWRIPATTPGRADGRHAPTVCSMKAAMTASSADISWCRPAVQFMAEGNVAAAQATFAQAAALGERFGDADLVSLARQGQGRMLIRLGEWARGTALLDEAMIAVTAGEVSSVVAGTIYCSVISACSERFDVRRAQEWTDALSRWCAAQPDLVPYRGECLVHRVEIKLLHGEWPDALQEARQACEQLSQSADSRVGRGALSDRRAQSAARRRCRGRARLPSRQRRRPDAAARPRLAVARSGPARRRARRHQPRRRRGAGTAGSISQPRCPCRRAPRIRRRRRGATRGRRALDDCRRARYAVRARGLGSRDRARVPR